MSEMIISKFEDIFGFFQSLRGNANVFLLSAIGISSCKEFWLGDFARNPNVFHWNVHNMKVTVSFSRKRNGHFHVVNIPMENVKVLCKVAKPDFDARRFHMSEIFRENNAGAPDLPPAIFFSAILFLSAIWALHPRRAPRFFSAIFLLRKTVIIIFQFHQV